MPATPPSVLMPAVIPIVAVVPILLILIPALFMAVTPAIMMSLLIMRDVHLVIPAVLNKVDPFAAGIVLSTVFAPVLRMARWHVQVDRLSYRDPLNQTRLTIKQSRLWIVADVDAAIEAGLANADRYADIGCECRNGGGG